MIRTAFNPVQHGFKFPNSFVNHVISVPALGIDFTTGGRCGGMAFAALDYWHHHLAIPEDSSLPVDGTLVSTYIYDRLMNSIMANAFKFFNFMRTPKSNRYCHRTTAPKVLWKRPPVEFDHRRKLR
jgi:hypothetical protein